MRISKNSIYTILVTTIFFDAYRFFAIGNRDITIWYVGALMLLFISLMNLSEVISGIKHNVWSLIMPIYMVVNYIIIETKVSRSLQIGLMCWGFYIFSYRKVYIKQFEKTVRIFQRIMNVLAIYGIYQVVAYKYRLPFANPWIEGFMVDGYNWGNYINIGGFTLRRANAVFREPSFFSQFLSINILIYLQRLLGEKRKNRKKDIKIIRLVVLNAVALLLSFSGTGLIMTSVGLMILILSNPLKITLKFLSRHSLLVLSSIIVIIGIMIIPNPLVKYLVSRTKEFDPSNIYSVSGYLRMVLPYQAACEILIHHNPIMGLGIGNAYGYVISTGYSVGASMQPILVRTLAEEGLVGGVLLLLFAVKLWNNNVKNDEYKAILVGIYLMSFMHGTWSSEVFWLLLGLLNVKFLDDSLLKNNSYIKNSFTKEFR